MKGDLMKIKIFFKNKITNDNFKSHLDNYNKIFKEFIEECSNDMILIN